MTPREKWNELDYEERMHILQEIGIDTVFQGLFASYTFQGLSFLAQSKLEKIWEV